jgi:hypothetical protein
MSRYLTMSFIHRGMLDEVKASERLVTSSGVGRADMVSIIAVSLCVPFLQKTENLRNWRCETLVSEQDYHQTAVFCIALRITCGMCVCVFVYLKVTGPFKGRFFLIKRTTAEPQTCRFIAEWEIVDTIC